MGRNSELIRQWTLLRQLAAVQQHHSETGPPTWKSPPERSAAIADSIKERTWHRSQPFKDRADGSVMMTLEVSDDYALRSWLLGFGRLVRVVAPSELAGWIQEELDQAHQRYAGGDHVRVADSDIQPGLPFLFNRLMNA